jgi:hypothetical protein
MAKPPEQYLLIPVVDGETQDGQAATIEIAEPEAEQGDDDPELTAVMREVAELADMGIVQIFGAPDDPDSRVNLTGKGWALLNAYDRGDTEAGTAIMRGDIVLYPA